MNQIFKVTLTYTVLLNTNIKFELDQQNLSNKNMTIKSDSEAKLDYQKIRKLTRIKI